MDFNLNKEQEMLKKSASEFLKKKVDKAVIGDIHESKTGFDKKVWKAMAKLDWMALAVPEDYEGLGSGELDLAVLFEEFGRAAFCSPMACTLMGVFALVEGGTDAQKEAMLPKVANGKMMLSMANEEPEVAYDHKFIAAKGDSNDGGFSLNGTKILVPYANVVDKILVSVRTSGNPGDEDGITVVIVDPKADGVSLTPIPVIGYERQFQIDLDNVAVSADDVVGEVGKGLSIVKTVLQRITTIQCAEMVGNAQEGLEMTANYTKERIQFKRAIATFQTVQHRIADMFVSVQSARWVTYQAAWMLGEGMPAGREVAIAKMICGKTVTDVAFSAQQLHGGMGVDMDYDLHWYYARAKNFELKNGSVPAQNASLQAEMGL